MVIAGPVFTEWYWGPVLFLIFFSPILAGLTIALYLVARRRIRRRRPLLLAGCFALSVGLTLAGGSAWRWVAFERESKAEARRLDFVTFLPSGYDAQRMEPMVADHAIKLTATYPGPLYLEQERAGPVDASDPARCEIFIAGPLATFPASLGPCRTVTSPGGVTGLLVDDTPLSATYSIREGTLLQVRHPGSAAADALELLDRLEPVDPEEIDFKR